MDEQLMFYAACLTAAAALGCGALLLVTRLPVIGTERIRPGGFCDLLDYAMLLGEHTVLLKSGALMQVCELLPGDLSYENEACREHIHDMLHRAIRKLPGAWVINVDITRREERGYLPFFENAHEQARHLDELRAACFEREHSFRNRFYLSITFLGYMKARARLEKMLIEDDEQLADERAYVQQFEARVRDIMDTVAHVIRVRPLCSSELTRGSELVSFLGACISGREHPVALPRGICYLDALLGVQDFYVGTLPRIGTDYIRAVAIDSLPQHTHFQMLGVLNRLQVQYRFSHRYCMYDSLQQAMLLEKMRRFWKQRSRGIIAQIFNIEGRENGNALAKVAEIDEAAERADNQELSFGSYSGTLVLYGPNPERLEEQARTVAGALENLGFCPRIETVNAVEAYLGSLPGHVHENLRRPTISSEVFIDLLALSGLYQGERSCPNPLYGIRPSPLMQCRLSGGENFYLNLHERDLGNTLVAGPPGAGKSVLLGALMLNFMRYAGMRIYAFDRGYSFYALCRAMDGTHIDFHAADGMLCPLRDVDQPQGLVHARQFIELLAALHGLTLAESEQQELSRCLTLLQDADERSLSQLHLLLQSPQLKLAVGSCTRAAGSSAILDGTDNFSLGGLLTVFELRELLELPERSSLPVLWQIFHLIEQGLDGSPCVLVLDEAWLMLRNAYFAGTLLKWFKTLRKHNALVILATQSLQDLRSSEHFENLLDCAKTRIFLPNVDAQLSSQQLSYQMMGLNELQTAAIARGQAKHDYFMLKNQHFAAFSLVLSPPERALLSQSGDHVVQRIDELHRRCGSRFYEEL